MVRTAKRLNLDNGLPLQMHGITNHLIAHAKELVHLSNIKILFELLVLVFKMDARGLTKNHILKWPQGAMLKDPRQIYSYCRARRECWWLRCVSWSIHECRPQRLQLSTYIFLPLLDSWVLVVVDKERTSLPSGPVHPYHISHLQDRSVGEQRRWSKKLA